MKPHYRLEVRNRRFGNLKWRVRDADGWYTEWQMSAREACAKMRAGLVL